MYVTFSLIGLDLADSQIENGPKMDAYKSTLL